MANFEVTTDKPTLSDKLMGDVVVCLVEPRIPQNFGNIARMCACIGAQLILIGDLGFSLDHPQPEVKRSGMDYLDHVDVKHYPDLPDALKDFEGYELAFLSSHAQHLYTEIPFQKPVMLIFGSETMGLPKSILVNYAEKCYTLPMITGRRSLNLSSTAAIVAYEGVRQRLS